MRAVSGRPRWGDRHDIPFRNLNSSRPRRQGPPINRFWGLRSPEAAWGSWSPEPRPEARGSSRRRLRPSWDGEPPERPARLCPSLTRRLCS